MRLIAAIMTLLALAAAGLAGQKLRLAIDPPEGAVDAALAVDIPDGTAQTQAPVLSSRRWPAVFGELEPPTPAVEPQPPAPEPPKAPPAPPAPPIESLGFSVKGVVRAGDAVWGLLSHPAGDKLVRVGQELAPDVIVRRIDEQGLWVDNGGPEPVLLGFQADRNDP